MLLQTKISAAKRTAAWQLALDKFPWSLRSRIPAMPDKKGDVLDPLIGRAEIGAEWKAAIERSRAWRERLETQNCDCCRVVSLVNASRLLLHLGRASVLENVGLYCERTTGLPVIPGSAVKGVVSNWACWAANEDRIYRPESIGTVNLDTDRCRFASSARRILGDNAENGSTAAGEIVFLGAWPEEPPQLGLDIVAPHHTPDGRDQDPKPNPFLCIEPGATWSFVLLARPRNGTGPSCLLDETERLLREALEQVGLGAKTAAGYGRFIDPKTWNDATLDEAAKRKRAEQDKKDADRKARIEELRSAHTGDYTETEFENAVVKRLSKPGEYQLLQAEVGKLQANPDNAPWIERLTAALRENKDARKRLKKKDWFPKSWLPQ